MRWSRAVSRHSVLVLVVAAMLLPPSLVGASRVGVNWDILSYLPRDVPSVEGLTILDRDFGDASICFLIVENRPLAALFHLKEAVEAVPGVADVIGFDDLVDPTVMPKEAMPESVRRSFVSDRGYLLIIRFRDPSQAPGTLAAVRLIRGLLDKDCYLSGATAAKLDASALTDAEGPLYLLLAVAVVVLILGLTMESWLIPVLFLLEMGLAIAFNLGTNIVLGRVSFLTQSLAAVLQLGVTMDFSIFLLHRYEEERAVRRDRREAMAAAIERTFANILGSALTDVAGFLALCAMDLSLGFDMGIVMSKGVIIGLVSTVTVLPSLILLLDGPIHRLSHRPIMFGFRGLAKSATRFPAVGALLFLLLLIPAAKGSMNLPQDYDISGGAPPNVPSGVAAAKLREDFGMLTTHFVIVRDSLPPAAARALVAELEALPGVASVYALEKFVGGLVPQEFLPGAFRAIFRQGGKALVVVTSTFAVGTPAGREQLEGVIETTGRHDPTGIVTGDAALSRDLVRVAAADFSRVGLISIAGIGLIVLAVFLSLSIPAILVAAIELAVMVNMAVPYFLGTEVSFISTAVIGCVQLGCTIDYSILLMSRFREELARVRAAPVAAAAPAARAGRRRPTTPSSAWRKARRAEAGAAMREAIARSAPSILTSGIILGCSTGGVSLVSSLGILKSVCALISRGAFVSVGVVLLLLPAILILAEPLVGATTAAWPRAGRPPRGRAGA